MIMVMTTAVAVTVGSPARIMVPANGLTVHGQDDPRERRRHWRRQREQWEPCAAPRWSPPPGTFGNYRGAVMSRLLMLAAAARPLSEALIDILRTSLKPRPALPVGGDERDRLEQFDLPLAQDEDADDTAMAMRPLPPDDAAVAIQFGRAFEQNRDALARLQNPDTVTIIEVPAVEFVDPIGRLLRIHVLGLGAPVLDGNGLSKEATIAAAGTVVLFKRKDEDKSKKSATDDAEFATAVQRRCAVIGIAADADRLLPRGLVRLAEHRIVVPALDASAVAAVIEAVTGRRPGAVDDDLGRRATLEALAIAVRGDLGAERSLARLTSLLGSKAANAEPPARLCDLHGLGPARDWALALIRDLSDYAAGRCQWASVDRGLLLTGPPGVGKTALARAIAGEANVHFVATSYAQWQSHREGHLGHVTQAIRNAFAEARQNSPSILFIDEIDTIPARGSGKWNDDWWVSITNTLLECLDGFERREGVVVIAACNDPARLDPALVRAGRLDRHIAIPLPDMPALMGIFRSHLGADLEGADLRAVALAARGHTGADVERWVRQARRVARTASPRARPGRSARCRTRRRAGIAGRCAPPCRPSRSRPCRCPPRSRHCRTQGTVDRRRRRAGRKRSRRDPGADATAP